MIVGYSSYVNHRVRIIHYVQFTILVSPRQYSFAVGIFTTSQCLYRGKVVKPSVFVYEMTTIVSEINLMVDELVPQ